MLLEHVLLNHFEKLFIKKIKEKLTNSLTIFSIFHKLFLKIDDYMRHTLIRLIKRKKERKKEEEKKREKSHLTQDKTYVPHCETLVNKLKPII